MTDTGAAAQIRRWLDTPHTHWSWPLDGDYDQHIAFVAHRNQHWYGGSAGECTAFCLAYAEHLDREATP